MSGGRRWLGVAAAVAVVAGIVALGRPSPRVPERSPPAASPPSAAADPARALGVASRPATVAGIGRIEARVVDEDEAPVGGGTVVLSCRSPGGVVGAIAGGAQRLDDDGAIAGPGCAGTVCVEYRHATHVATEPWVLERNADGSFDARVFVAQVRPRLWGEVVDATGAPVANASVSVTAAESGGRTGLLNASTRTDAAGEFSLGAEVAPPCDPCRDATGCPDPLPPPGARTVLVHAPGHGPATVDLRADGSEAARAGADPDDPLSIILPPAAPAIEGTLLANDGLAWPRATVLARSVLRPAEQHRVDASSGSFTIPWVGEGPYHLRAIQDGVALGELPDVQPGDDVVLPPVSATPRSLVVQLVDGGRPYPGATVRGGPFAQARTDSSGQVRAARVIPGKYVVRVHRAARDAPAPRDATSGRVTIALPPAHGAEAAEHRVVVDATQLQVL